MNPIIRSKPARFALAIPAVIAVLMLMTGLSQAMAASTTSVRGGQLDNTTAATFGGRAFAMSVSSLLGSTTFWDTGQLAPSGGEMDATAATIQTPIGSADGLISVTMGLNNQAESDAGLGAIDLLPGTSAEITAFFAMATSRATCSGPSGFSDIADLAVGGMAVPVTGQPNQVFSIPGVLSLTINEQTLTPDGTGITVNALDLQTADGTQAIVGSAFSSVSCTNSSGIGLVGTHHIAPAHGVPVGPVCVDFTTGGGWIVPQPPFTGDKSTFGFVAGYKNGGTNPRGQLEYHDHTFGFNVHSEDVLYYNCGLNPDGTTSSNTRVFGGHAEVNHVSGYCYQVYAQDNGEPGVGNDYFAIWVWAPPTTCPSTGHPPGDAAYANGNFLGGGNIEIHKAPGSP